MNEVYTLIFSSAAQADLAKLPKAIAAQLIAKLEWLVERVHLIQHIELTGQWSGFYKLRKGDYRIIYRLDDKKHQVIVERVGHRRDVYID